MAYPKYWKAVATLTDATPVELKAAVTGRQHVVTRVVTIITTHANAKYIRVQDSADTPVVMFHQHDLTKAAGVPDMVEMHFGNGFKPGAPTAAGGFAGTVSKAVNAVSEASGPAGKVFVEGYTI